MEGIRVRSTPVCHRRYADATHVTVLLQNVSSWPPRQNRSSLFYLQEGIRVTNYRRFYFLFVYLECNNEV